MNEARLEKRLRFQLECSRFVWVDPTPDRFAEIDADGGMFTIALPTRHLKGGTYDDDYLLQTLFHELVHVSMPGELWCWGDFQEDILLRVVEPRLMNYLSENAKVQAWWLKRLKNIKKTREA